MTDTNTESTDESGGESTGRKRDRKSIKIFEETYEEHKPRKDEQGLTWDEYIRGQRNDARGETEEMVREAVRDEVTRVLQTGGSSDGSEGSGMDENAMRELVREEVEKVLRDNLQTV